MSFYCKRTGDGSDFSIKEWNEKFKANLLAGKEMPSETVCEKQCFNCMAEVGERRKKTEKLITKQIY